MRDARRELGRRLAIIAVLACAVSNPALAADSDDTVARAKQLLHRTQEALREAQSANTDLTRAKLQAEQQLQQALKQIASEKGSSKAARASLQTQLQTNQDARTEFERKLSDGNARLAELMARQNETAKQLAARESELAGLKQTLEQSKAATASCEAKNLKLYGYANEVLQRYQKKGVWAALSQKEPVLGFADVAMDNVVQEYRTKFEDQKVKP